MNIDQAQHQSAAFYLAFQRCMEQRPLPGGQIQFLGVPGVVCIAFSIELGFKTLILKSGGTPRGHNLNDLFSCLPRNSSLRDTSLQRWEFRTRYLPPH